MRSLAFHCLFLPFSYNVSSLSRPSSYSQLKTVVTSFEGTRHWVCSTGSVYIRVLIDRMLLAKKILAGDKETAVSVIALAQASQACAIEIHAPGASAIGDDVERKLQLV